MAPLSIAAVFAAILVATVLLRPSGHEPQPAPPPAPPPPAVVPTPPPAEPRLGRAQVLDDADKRAAAYAAGPAAAALKDTLAGRDFALRIPFGCQGPQAHPGASQAYYEFDPQKRTVRLVARPALWTGLPALQQGAGGAAALEAVEGFWIPHPWSDSESCPPQRDAPIPAAPTPPAAETVGLAQLFDKDASRVDRRADRPYVFLRKLADDEKPPLAAGYRLVLEGRFATFPDGRTARCWSESPDHRPICIYAVELGRVAFETADGRQLAEWRN